MVERRPLVLGVIFGLITIMVGSIPALISAAIALGAFKNYEVNVHYDIDDQHRYQFYTATVMAIINSLLGIIIKFPLIMFHFLTISDNVVDTKTKVFRVLDIATSFGLAVGHSVSGILLNISSNTLGYSSGSIGFIKSAINASQAFCFIGANLYVGVALLMIFFFFVHKVRVTTRVFTPAVQTTAVTNEPDDEQEVHVNEENTSLIT